LPTSQDKCAAKKLNKCTTFENTDSNFLLFNTWQNVHKQTGMQHTFS